MKVSILTACHDDARFIKQCGKSILRQDFRDIEWIVVDDCSSDSTVEILEGIKDSRLRLFQNETQMFCSSSYAKALQAATGDICAVVDGDDALVPGAVSALVAMYKKHPHLGYIYTQHWWCDVDLKKKRKGLSGLPPGSLSFTRSSIKYKKHSFSHWRTFKTHLRDQACLFPEGLRYSVDKNLGFALERVAYGGFYPEPLYLYRYYKGNMSLVHAGDQKKTWARLAEEYEKKQKRTLPVVRIK